MLKLFFFVISNWPNFRRRLHANPGIGSRKHRVLRRRQVKIEAEAWELATKEYKELSKDMCDLLKS
jgi:DNA-directed RNA polymerase